VSHGVRVRRADVRDLPRIVELRLALLDEHSDNPLYGRLRPDAEARAPGSVPAAPDAGAAAAADARADVSPA